MHLDDRLGLGQFSAQKRNLPLELGNATCLGAHFPRLAATLLRCQACQNTVVALLRRFDPAKARLTTYLTVIATSTAIDHLRRSKPQARALDDVPETALAVEAVEPVRIKIPEGLLSPRQALVMELLHRKDLDPAEAEKLRALGYLE